MAKKPRNTVPTSVILTHEQKAFIKQHAEKEARSYSGMVRYIIVSWVDFHSKKKARAHGKESEKGEEVGQKSEEVSS